MCPWRLSGRRAWDKISPQLALDNTTEISFGFCTSWTQSCGVWNYLTVRPILGRPAKTFACFIMLPFVEKELLVDENFLPHRTSWSSRLAFRPIYVNPTGQTEPLLLYPQPVLLERKAPAHTLLDLTASQFIPLACTPEVFDLKSLPWLLLVNCCYKRLERHSNSWNCQSIVIIILIISK